MEGLDHHGLCLDRGAVPPVAVFQIAPEQAEFFISHGAFLDGGNDEARETVVLGFLLEFANAVHGDGDLCLIHPAKAEEVLRAVLFLFDSLIDEVLHGLAMLRGDRAVFQEERAAVEVLSNQRGEVVGLEVAVFLDPQVGTVHPIVEAVDGFDGHAGIDIHIHRPHSAEAGGDVEGDVITRTSAGHPRPGAVGKLHFAQFAHGGLGFVGEALVFEQDAYIAAGLTFVLGLTQPRGFLEHHALEVLVFLQWTIECWGVAPFIKHLFDARIAVGDVAAETVGVQAGEGAHGARVRVLHEIGQGHHGVPAGVGNHLHGESLVLDGVALAGGDKFVELEVLGLGAADGQREAFGDEDAAAEHGQKALFAIGHFVSAAHGFEGEEAKVVWHTETPAVAAALVGWHGEGLVEIHIAEQFVNVVLGEGFGEG